MAVKFDQREPETVPQEADPTPPDTWRMECTLDGLAFPARRWQLIAQAELNGVDGVTHERLRRLPARPYENSADVAGELIRRDG